MYPLPIYVKNVMGGIIVPNMANIVVTERGCGVGQRFSKFRVFSQGEVVG
jgi:hypothetical protein